MEVRMNCPECVNRGRSPDTEMHLHYNTDKRVWICFRCGFKGKGDPPGGEAFRCVGQIKQMVGEQISDKARPLFDLLLENDFSLITARARHYLESHHIEPKNAAFRYKLLVDGTDLVFPVYRGKEIVYFQKRNLMQKKFSNPLSMDKPVFWSEEYQNPRCVVIVESVVNAIRLAPLCTSAAIFGKFLSDSQCEEIMSKSTSIDILLDAGETEASMAMARKLWTCGAEHVFIRKIPGEIGRDPCDCDNEEIMNILNIREW